MKKRFNYLLGLLSITIPNQKPVHRDSKGNPVNVLNIRKERPTTRTVYPNDNIHTWDNLTPENCHVWISDLNVGRTHTRFIVGDDNTILNKGKLILEKVEKHVA